MKQYQKLDSKGHAKISKSITLYLKRILLLDRLRSTVKMFGLSNTEILLTRATLNKCLHTHEFIRNSLFAKEFNLKNIQDDIALLQKKLTSKDYKTSLTKIIHYFLGEPPENILCIYELMNNIFMKQNLTMSNDRDLYI